MWPRKCRIFEMDNFLYMKVASASYILHPTMAFVEHLALFAISGTSIDTRPEPRISETHTEMRQKLVTCQNFRRIPYRPQPEYTVPMEIPHIIEAIHYTWQNAPLFGGNNAAWNELLFKALLWFESKDRLVKIIFRGRPVEDKKGSRSFCFGARGICREMIDVVIVSTDSKHCNHYKHVVKDTSDLTTFQVINTLSLNYYVWACYLYRIRIFLKRFPMPPGLHIIQMNLLFQSSGLSFSHQRTLVKMCTNWQQKL